MSISRRNFMKGAMAAGVAAVFAGDVVVDTLADSNLLSNTAEAQGRGGRGGGWGGGMSGMREIRELLEPDFSRRDMPLFLEQLNLDDGPAHPLGPVPIERRTPLTRGDASREAQMRERIRLETKRMEMMFVDGFGGAAA